MSQGIIKKILEDRLIPVSGSVARDGISQNRFYVFVPVSRNSENLQQPSNKLLHTIREELLQNGVEIEYILTDETNQDVEVSVRASILHSFGNIVRNSFLTNDERKATVWLDLKKDINLK